MELVLCSSAHFPDRVTCSSPALIMACLCVGKVTCSRFYGSLLWLGLLEPVTFLGLATKLLGDKQFQFLPLPMGSVRCRGGCKL